MKIGHFTKQIDSIRRIIKRSRISNKRDPVGILIVNGGEVVNEGNWLELCLAKIYAHTNWPNYKIYIWNNNTDIECVNEIISKYSQIKLFNAVPGEKLKHVHAEPLQRLYEFALADGIKYIITMDTDAFPIRDGWIEYLIQHLDKRTVIAGVWRDELDSIEPYIHPSCLCTSADFIEHNNLRFDRIDIVSDRKIDTLSCFSQVAMSKDKNLFKLMRSNKNQLHYIMGGIYGNLIYHQGAGSRKGNFFWGENRIEEIHYRNERIKQALNHLIFKYNRQFTNWLLGNNQLHAHSHDVDRIIFLLGMPESGCDCIAGVLNVCGLVFHEKEMTPGQDPKGWEGLNEFIRLYQETFRMNKGSWMDPPKKLSLSSAQRRTLAKIINSSSNDIRYGFNHPLVLFIAELWANIKGEAMMFIGSYAHPAMVAMSLSRVYNMDYQNSINLWKAYNKKLIQLHKKYKFPIIKFDPSDLENYIDAVVLVSIELGLNPDLKKIENFLMSCPSIQDNHETLPDECRDHYRYLEKNSFEVNTNSFSYHIFALKKELQQ